MPAPAATAAAAAAAAPVPPAPKGRSRLLAIVVAIVMLAGSAGAAWFYMSKRHAASAEEEPAAHAPQARHAPTYLPLESMVVNLADPGGERFAQIGVTLDIENEKAVDQIKAFMPAIRSNVLMLVSQRTSEELLKRDGKEKLAADIVAEVSRALGYEVDTPEPRASAKKAKAESADDDEEPAPKRKSKKGKAAPSPVNGVLFSSFIVQ
ncbi:flagellar basal body-associated FliL family protein [Variovorax humicola]|uniref:Flagellar protein FliL n=1 Tax=Variovorax humicola TaxID=1769758 RepID=A0ABU8W6K5_9BURK